MRENRREKYQAARACMHAYACVVRPMHALVHSGSSSTLGGGVISIRCWGSSVENHKTHAVDPPHHTVLYCATDCQLGAAGWPYGPCDRAGRPSRPPLHGYGWRSGPAARKGPCIMVHCTVKKKSHSLLATR